MAWPGVAGALAINYFNCCIAAGTKGEVGRATTGGQKPGKLRAGLGQPARWRTGGACIKNRGRGDHGDGGASHSNRPLPSWLSHHVARCSTAPNQSACNTTNVYALPSCPSTCTPAILSHGCIIRNTAPIQSVSRGARPLVAGAGGRRQQAHTRGAAWPTQSRQQAGRLGDDVDDVHAGHTRQQAGGVDPLAGQLEGPVVGGGVGARRAGGGAPVRREGPRGRVSWRVVARRRLATSGCAMNSFQQSLWQALTCSCPVRQCRAPPQAETAASRRRCHRCSPRRPLARAAAGGRSRAPARAPASAPVAPASRRAACRLWRGPVMATRLRFWRRRRRLRGWGGRWWHRTARGARQHHNHRSRGDLRVCRAGRVCACAQAGVRRDRRPCAGSGNPRSQCGAQFFSRQRQAVSSTGPSPGSL